MGPQVILSVVSLVGVMMLAACSPALIPTPNARPTIAAPMSPIATATATESGELATDALTAMAQEDLAMRLGMAVDQVEVVGVVETMWPDGSLGCPQPGVSYIQAEQPGVVIRLQAAGQIYAYHSGAGQPPFLCEWMTLNEPKGNEFVPPPGSDVD